MITFILAVCFAVAGGAAMLERRWADKRSAGTAAAMESLISSASAVNRSFGIIHEWQQIAGRKIEALETRVYVDYVPAPWPEPGTQWVRDAAGEWVKHSIDTPRCEFCLRNDAGTDTINLRPACADCVRDAVEKGLVHAD